MKKHLILARKPSSFNHYSQLGQTAYCFICPLFSGIVTIMKWVALTLLVILASLQYRMWFGQTSFREIKQQEARAELVKSENAELALRNQKILAEIHDLREGTDAIEERARYQLGMIKEGETFFRILDSRESSRQDTRQETRQDSPK